MNQQLLENKKLKIVHSYPIWLPKTQTWMYNQVRYLPKNLENHVVCEKTEDLEQFWLPNIHALQEVSQWCYVWDKVVRKLQFRHHLGFLVDIAQHENINVLHSHFGHVGWQDIGAAKKVGLKHVVTFYGWDVNSLPKTRPHWRRRYQELFANVDIILCEGSHMAKCIVNLGCPADKVKVHHLGIAIEELKFQPRVWNPNEPLRVLIAASFREKKGIPYALEALGQLQHQVSLEVTIIGDANSEKRSQAEKQKILATIEKHNLQSKVRMLGYQPYTLLFKEAYKHHIFLSPSVTASDGDTEGGAPVSLIEMAATGMLIVSTNHCDIPEVVINGLTGLLAEERDVSGLVTHLQQLVHHPEQWLPITVAGRKHVEKEYDAYIQGKKLAEIYSHLAMKKTKK
ncbi:MAG: glycosyltransferase [Goleter apudmare HA4340-LM2]|jgi:colanic acid/amylovoran biosynthesis glycosyltransferase|nr:glycosyltransferase [Goleter apudmare HA4340-LM2]